MAVHIPDDKLAQIRNAADIVDIISARVYLKKAGKDYAGLCPFHSEKTPSFTVSPAKQIYHCFGCGAGGDVFDFLMAYEGLSFPETIEALARQYGIDMPSRQMSSGQKRQVTEREHLLRLNKQVMGYFREQLLKKPAGEIARRYLKNRGMHPQLVDGFGLGFAPEGWDGLIRYLNKAGVPLPLAEKAGLVVPKKQKGFYDRFRNRIIFPIFDVTGQVVGFGGRVLDDAKPKYLNSPETPLYNKRRILYGLHAAKDKCRQAGSVFIVEGYFDLLALHQHGVANSVASLGTALTQEHIRRLKGYAKKAYLVFDSDEAGLKAAQRSIGLFLDEGMDAAVVLLPDGHDPDSFVFEAGADAFYKAAENALGMTDFLMETTVKRHGLTMEGKVRILADMTETLAGITDSVARSLYTRLLAERIGVDETAILEKIREHGKNSGLRTATAPVTRQPEKPAPPDRMESRVIAMMLQHPDILSEIRRQKVLDSFEDIRLKEIGNLILSVYPHPVKTVAEFMNCINDENQRRLVASLCIEDGCWQETSCSMLLTQFFNVKGRRKTDLLNRIRQAEKSDDHELLLKLLTEKQRQMTKRHQN